MNLLERIQKCHDKHVSKGEVLAYDSLEFNISWTELLDLAKQVNPDPKPEPETPQLDEVEITNE